MQNIINEKEFNPNIFDTIKRYPFNGRSKYLIDKFYLIGYDYGSIHKLFIESPIKDIIKEQPKTELNDSDFNDLIGSKKIKKEEEFKSIIIPKTPPILLNEIASDYKKQIPSFDIIRNMIFPNGCEFFYTVENYKEESFKNLDVNIPIRTTISSVRTEIGNDGKKKNKKNKLPKSYNVIFSYNPQEGNNSKKSINGFSFVFYKRHFETKTLENKIYYFYIPYTFCIISEYPFYNSYYNLCNQLYNLIKSRKVEIPLEIIIYNIVNYTSSPLNSDVFLNLDAFNYPHDYLENDIKEIKEEIEFEKEEEDIIIIDNINENENKNNNNKDKQIKEENNEKRNMDIQKITKNYKKERNLTLSSNIRLSTYDSIFSLKAKPFQKIKFEILSGYPLIQYNLVKVLLNKMNPADVIIIFFYTFLEKSIIFFSKNIELLSLTINSYHNLNFPLNDEKYYFYNVSTSYEDYMEGNSMFIGTTFTNTIGINSKYKENYKNNHVRLAEHLTVDLDKGTINQVEDDNDINNEKEERDNRLFDFFRQIFRNREMKEKEKQSILYREVKTIFEKLSYYKELFTKKNTKEKKDEYKKIVNGNYIDYDDNEESIYSIKNTNRDIQESFYTLVNNLCIYFYQNLSLKSYEDNKNQNENNKKGTLSVIFNDDTLKQDNNYIQEEKDFLYELRETMKFQSFVYGFIQSYNPIDLYKIPLTFTEEFLSMLTTKRNIYNKNKNNIKFLSLIDSIYKRYKKKPIQIDYSQFIQEYFKKYKSYFDREIYDTYDSNKINIILTNYGNEKINIEGIKYLTFELNNDIIFKYKYLIDNLDKKEFSLLLNNEIHIRENKIEKIMLADIESSIEKNLMQIGLITSNDICFSNIILLFIISMKKIAMKFDYHIFLSSLFHQCKIFRKYYTMIIEIIYKLMKISLEKKKYQEAETYLMSYYPFINSLRTLGLVPNENLINILKKFHQMTIDEIQNADSKNDINEKDDEILKDYEEINFDEKCVYICNNFTYDKFIKEVKILIDVNKLYKTSKEEFNLGINKDGSIHKPKIKINKGKFKYECDIFSQMKIFEILSNEYIIYITSNLNDKFLNVDQILPICLNIMIYFRNTANFDGKDEINFALIEIYNLYLNLFIQRTNNNDIIK